MNSRRPYLLRAMHEWMVDTDQTPYVLVDARQDGVEVPSAYVQDGKIVLNISPGAAHRLALGNEFVSFDARFAGTPHHIKVPIVAVLAIYARETGQGMMFGMEDELPESNASGLGHGPEQGNDQGEIAPAQPAGGKQGDDRPRGKPTLKVVK